MLILGLGNPEPRFTNSPHNIGFFAVEHLAEQFEGTPWANSPKIPAEVSSIQINDHKIILGKPTTYMNESGQAAQKLLQWYDINPEELVVIYDDVETQIGELQHSNTGSAKGHNGIRSIQQHLGDTFHRIKVGAAHQPKTVPDLAAYVLAPMSKEDQEQIAAAIHESLSKIIETQILKML